MTAPPLHDYQRVAVAHLQANPRAALFLEMGLGKTAATLRALTPAHLPAVVLAPPRVARLVWPQEAALWRPDLRVAAATGGPAQRAAALAGLGTTYDLVAMSAASVADLRNIRPRTLILDELSLWKNRATVRWRRTRALAMAADYCWGLTGTPSPNGLMDLWAQLYLLDQGARLGRNLTAYRQEFFQVGRLPNGRPAQLQNGTVTKWELLPGAQERIMASLEDICLSMQQEGRLHLPSLTHNLVQVELPAKARQVYRTMKRDLLVGAQLLGETYTAANAAVLSSRLSQVTAGFLYSDDQDLHPGQHQVLHTEKMAALREIIDGTGSPVLVFYRFRAELEMIRAAVPEARLLTDPGVVDQWNLGRVPVMLAHPASAGHGLNLQHGGHTAVWTSLPWSLEQWQQSNGRLLRQGQRHPVVVHVIQAERSVDAVVRSRLDQKADVQLTLMDHLESPV